MGTAVYRITRRYTCTMRGTNRRLNVQTQGGAVVPIHDATPSDTVLIIKRIVFVAIPTFPVRRQRVVYMAGTSGSEPLDNHMTLGGAGVVDGATLDVLLVDLTSEELEQLDDEACIFRLTIFFLPICEQFEFVRPCFISCFFGALSTCPTHTPVSGKGQVWQRAGCAAAAP